jgi:uncharacterized membrane protein
MFYLSERQGRSISGLAQAVSCVFFVVMATWEISCRALDFVEFRNGWHMAILPLLSLRALQLIAIGSLWPFNRYQDDLNRFAVPVLSVFILGWSVIQFSSSGIGYPFPWIPILNPIDLVQILIIVALIRGRLAMDLFNVNARIEHQAKFVLAGFTFLWINVDLLRLVHHWYGYDWHLFKLIGADVTQTILSLVWTTLGLAGTWYAARKNDRKIWIYSAILLGLVIAKLFTIDLAAQETIERIVSFTGVGILLTLVGYFSPIPPKEEEAELSS